MVLTTRSKTGKIWGQTAGRSRASAPTTITRSARLTSIQIQWIYGKTGEKFLRSRISNWYWCSGGFACPDCARSPRMVCEAQLASPRKSTFRHVDFRGSIEKNYPTCCQRIDCGQIARHCQPIECRASCLPCRLGSGMRSDNLCCCETTSVAGSSSGRSGGNCWRICRLPHKEKAQPRHA